MVIENEKVLLAIEGDRAAFGELYEAVAAELYKVALYTLGNAADAEDAVADTFMDAYKEIGSLREAGSFRPWIFRILSVKCKKKIAGYIKERGNLDIEDYEAVEPDDAAGKSELADALRRLAPEERQMVLLSAVGGYTIREIAGIMEVPSGTVSSKISRTMKKLREMLKS